MATYQLKLRNRKPNKNGKYPILFKVYLGNKSKIITLPFSCNLNQWDETNKRLRKNYPKYKEINETLKILDSRLQNAIDDLETREINYDLQDIEKVFKDENKSKRFKIITVSEFLENVIAELEDVNNFGYARAIKDTKQSLFKFAKTDLKFKQITPEFLDKYESFLRKTCDNGGISFRMRDIRTAYNKAIKYGYADRNYYPFDVYKISKLKPNSRKIAITKEELELFKNFSIQKKPEYNNTYKMFLFSYYTGGMNFKDMTLLKWENVKNNRLSYIREKTKSDFNLILHIEALKILDHFKNNSFTENTDYIFPVIHKFNLTDKQKHGRYRRCIKKFNKELKIIASEVGIDKSLTSYVARHSFATHLKFNGVSEEVISQLMGHSNVSVTKAYLKDFGNDALDDAMSKLN